jgi:sigma-B regulation protein RsbU (phosphoserine phosphatase)
MFPCRLATILVLLSALGAMAETHSVSAQGRGGEPHARQVESFDGPWRVHAGDDPQGASPTEDDSAWQQVELGSTESKNLSTAEGVLWFRALIPWQNIPANSALLIAPKATGCQIFVNGSKVSDCNRLPGPNYYIQRGILIHLTGASPGSPSLLAIRLDQAGKTRSGAVGLGKGDVLLGTSALLSDRRTALDAARFYRVLPQDLLCLGELLGGAVLLLAFAFDRGSREYLWFAAFLWLDGSASLMSCFDVVYPIVGPAWQRWLNEFGQIARYAPLIGFLAAFTKVRMNWALRGYQVILLLVPEVLAAARFYGLGRYLPNFAYVLLAVQLPFVAGSLVFLAMQWRRGSRDAALLLPSFLLANGFEVLGLTRLVGRFHLGTRFSYDCDDLSMFFFLISIAPVMIARHRRITMEHARTNADLEAAREVQRQLVVPAADVPGFRVESAYAPAKQVGGDFFRVMPVEDGGVLVVVGDVSGKGLKAAMTVSAIMGSLHDYASSRPAEVLAHLNRVLHGRMDGFVTCCAAHIAADGTMTLANAGGPAPYLNGEEMAVEPGLPLGILGEASYAETRYQIAPNDRLTFVSDGVVEATNPQGELYGFERTEAISNQPAKAIAEAATQFGQEDDITVLSVTRTVGLNPALA